MLPLFQAGWFEKSINDKTVNTEISSPEYRQDKQKTF